MDLSRTPHDETEEAWHARRAAYEQVLTGLEVNDPNVLSPEVQLVRDALLLDLQERWDNGDVFGAKRKRKPGEKSTNRMDAETAIAIYGNLLGFLLITSSLVLFFIDMELAAYAFGAGFLIILLTIVACFLAPTPRPIGPPVKPICGFNWISHVRRFTEGHTTRSYINSHAEENLELINWVYERELSYIKRVHGLFGRGSKQYDVEVATLELMITREREHFARENYRQIPMDPEKQTPIQKLIVNAEHEMYAHHKIKDPDSGAYWDCYDGFPCLSPEMEKYKAERMRWESDKTLVWDDKRSATRNIFRFLGKFGSEG